MMKKIAILTYNHPHRKTQDILFQLLALQITDITLLIQPWKVFKKKHIPLYQHRPQLINSISPIDLCYALGLSYIKCENNKKLYTTLHKECFDYIFIGGAGIIDKNITDHFNIINVHPGYLPNTRGLDAYKWAIYEGQPIGVTAHYINHIPDAGILITREIIPVHFNDTYHSVAMKVYHKEITMFTRIILSSPAKFDAFGLDLGIESRYFNQYKRMSPNEEYIMINRFEEIRKKSSLI